jgi:quinol monooxygenase YgiN
MIYVLWQFRAKPDKVDEFERDYGPEGVWAQLFRRSPQYERSVLLRDPTQEASYVVIDIWHDEASYQRFKKEFHDEYQRIDRQCEALTLEEKPLGILDEVMGSQFLIRGSQER